MSQVLNVINRSTNLHTKAALNTSKITDYILEVMFHRVSLKDRNMCGKGVCEGFITKTYISLKGLAKGINIQLKGRLFGYVV